MQPSILPSNLGGVRGSRPFVWRAVATPTLRAPLASTSGYHGGGSGDSVPQPARMTFLGIRDLSIRLGRRALLEGAGLQVDDGRKICLIGRNEAGKTTSQRAIMGELQPDEGGD